MSILVRPYRPSDRGMLRACATQLQDSMVQIDPWKLTTRTDDHASVYSAHVLEKVRRFHGFILIAEVDRQPVGACVGWVEPASRVVRTETRPTRAGYVSDLVVLKPWRGKGIGSRLLRAAETRFRRDGCDAIGLGVFYPNTGARRLYRKSGYSPRGMYLMKRLARPPTTWTKALKRGKVEGARRAVARRPSPRRPPASAAKTR
jgi:ribosomal protein S18 acetylase RimI-like enzyme